MLSDLRLLQLVSPSLPVGAFTYSQGLEWAVESGWVSDVASFRAWLSGQLEFSLVTLELPVLRLLCNAIAAADWIEADRLSGELLAWRETRELRLEEQQRGQAFTRLLPELGIAVPDALQAAAQRSQLVGLALAAAHWQITPRRLLAGYLWSWLENAVMAGVKLIPLGQTEGQRLLASLSPQLANAVERSLGIDRDQIGSSTPALAIASSRHETQYTRLFRS